MSTTHRIESDIEFKLISKIMFKGDMDLCIERQLLPDQFYDERARKAYDWVYCHRRKYDEMPSLDLFEETFPDVRLDHAKEALGWYIDKMMENYVRNAGTDVILNNVQSLEEDPLEGLEILRTELGNIDVRVNPTNDMDLTKLEYAEDAIQEYEERENMEGIDGFPFPWETLNEATQGLHEGELLSIVARPSVGKTFKALKIVSFFIEHGIDVILNTREMPAKQIRRRFFAVHFKLPFRELRSGMLTPEQKKRYVEGVRAFAKGELESVHTISKKKVKHGRLIITECTTTDQLRTKIKQYSPDVWFADGAYLFYSGAKDLWSQATQISRELKQICMDTKVPGGATWQFNRGVDSKKMDGGLENIGLSDAVGQDSDIVLGLFANKDLELNRERLIRMLKVREAEKADFRVGWNLGNGSDCMTFPDLADAEEFSIDDDDEPIDF